MRQLLVAAALVGLLAPAARAQQPSAREAGDALRASLGEAPPRADLAGSLRLPVHIGEARSGVLVLRTELVTTADGTPIYRLQDRLEVELAGLGVAFLTVRADLRADLTAIEVVLETEEPRGTGSVSRQRVRLHRGGGQWLREVTRGEAAPVETPLEGDLPPSVLVLTPPLGAGERLARLVPNELGKLLSVQALDLETGLPATWRAWVEDRRPLALLPTAPGAAPPAPLDALVVLRQESAASLATLRDAAAPGTPWRVTRHVESRPDAGAQGPRLVAQDARFAPPSTDPPPAVARVLILLRATASGDREAARESLDLEALWTAVGGGTAAERAAFEAVLLERLTDSAWLRDRGLLVSLLTASADDFVTETLAPDRVRVRPRAATPTGPTFVVADQGGRWRVVDLPR